MGSFSIWHWLIVLAIVVVLFGTKKLGDLGSDLGRAVKGFKDGVRTEDDKAAPAPAAVTGNAPAKQDKPHTDDKPASGA